MRYTDRTIVITGASDGIGAGLARRLAREGPRLALAARSAERLERVAAEWRARGACAIAVTADVAIDDDCKRLVESAAGHFGGIDVLVANAGLSMHARFDQIEDFSTFERLWRINCMGTISCTRSAWPHLKASRAGCVGPKRRRALRRFRLRAFRPIRIPHAPAQLPPAS